MSVYLVGQLTVTNWKWYREYQEVTEKLVSRHNGKYLVKSSKIDHLEGDEPVPSALVIIEFPDKEDLESWYKDPEYQPMIDLRKRNNVVTELYSIEKHTD